MGGQSCKNWSIIAEGVAADNIKLPLKIGKSYRFKTEGKRRKSVTWLAETKNE